MFCWFWIYHWNTYNLNINSWKSSEKPLNYKSKMFPMITLRMIPLMIPPLQYTSHEILRDYSYPYTIRDFLDSKNLLHNASPSIYSYNGFQTIIHRWNHCSHTHKVGYHIWDCKSISTNNLKLGCLGTI